MQQVTSVSTACDSLATWLQRSVELLRPPSNGTPFRVLTVGSQTSADAAYLDVLSRRYSRIGWSTAAPLDGGSGVQATLTQVALRNGASLSVEAVLRGDNDAPPNRAFDLVLHGPHFFDDRSPADTREFLARALRWACPACHVVFCCPRSEAPGLLRLRHIAERRMPPDALPAARQTCSSEGLQELFTSKQLEYQCDGLEAQLDLSECAAVGSAWGRELFAACLGRSPRELGSLPRETVDQLIAATLASCVSHPGAGGAAGAAAGPAAAVHAPLHLDVFVIPAPGVSGPATAASAAAAAASASIDPNGMVYERGFATARERQLEWWPGGVGKRFHNWGLANWHRQRAEWRRSQNRPRPARPPPVPYDELIEGLANLRRTFELPGRMALPELIEVYLDIWESQESY